MSVPISALNGLRFEGKGARVAELPVTMFTETQQVFDMPVPDVPAPRQANVSASGNTAQTHVFWSPFRSAWAAKGFARRLSNATQIPIDIVKAGSGQYRVSFDYRDESERLEHVERIESITGLQLE